MGYEITSCESSQAMHTIDFADVPDFSRTKMLIQLDTAVSGAIGRFPQTTERALCATHFSGLMCSEVRSAQYDHLTLRQGYMRASLAEFVGMEESLQRDLSRLGIEANPLKANTGTRPLLHIIRELRNFELHLHSSPLTKQSRQALWLPLGDSDEERSIEYQGWIIDDLTESQFRQLRNARHYQDDDIRRLVAWFNAAQREWGVHDLILRAIETFCMDIISHYAAYLPAESTDA
jgi:hypothetical protein